MKEKIETLIKNALKNLGISEVDFVVEHPADLKMGDFSTNVAMALAKAEKKNPKELADKIVSELEKQKNKEIQKIETAGAGFINFYLSPEYFTGELEKVLKDENFGKGEVLKGKKVMVEYTQPNPFKPFHIGHLMSNAIGESLSRIVEFQGAKVVRANYQGDVGPHVAKAIWGMYKAGPPADESAPASVLAQYIGECYVKGSDAYDNDVETKKEIDDFNKRVYDRSDEEVNKVYDWGRKVTLEAFEELYKILGTKFDYYFFESVMAPIGEKIVRANTGKIFEESDGAIVFKAEKYNSALHTRVFITSAGLPTYETKELGLTQTKFEKENPDISIVDTATEQAEYMKVVEQAITLINPEYARRMKHVTHGMMRFASGKMSSRKGNVITGESLIRDTVALIQDKMQERDWRDDDKVKVAEIVGVASIKYSILRSKMGSDIVYDVDKSISVEGDSGPYLQYALTRATSVLEKAKAEKLVSSFSAPSPVGPLEKMLARFPEIALRAYEELEPHHIVTYLTELASLFNSFYAQSKIVDSADPQSPYKLAVTQSFANIMVQGLTLLGIKVPEKM